MKVVDPGHTYKLNFLDGEPLVASPSCEEQCLPNWLTFVKREGEMYPGNVGSHPGTTIQEVCRVLIDRLKYVNAQIRHESNGKSLNYLRRVIWALEQRAAERHGRLPPFAMMPPDIENIPTCPTCGHLWCEEHAIQGASER